MGSVQPAAPTIPLLPFLVGAFAVHVGVMALVPLSSGESAQVAMASQVSTLRLVMPAPRPEPTPEPVPVAPPPSPVTPPPRSEAQPVRQPTPLPPMPAPPPVPESRPMPAPPPPPPLETVAPAEVAEPAAPDPWQEPPSHAHQETSPPEQPQEQTEPPPEKTEPTNEAPQAGDADEDRSGVAVQAVPDPQFAPRPKYPRKARVRKWEGTTTVEVDVAASGTPTAVRLFKSSGHEILDEAAIATVRTWKFVPGRSGGRAAASTVHVPVTFRLVDR